MAEADRPTRAVRGGPEAPPPGALRLIAIEGPDRGATWDAGARCAIGSHDGSDVRLSDDTVSRFHCELTVTPRGVRIRDLESKNGTIVDGTRVLDGFVRDGSVLVLGATWLRVEQGVVGAAAGALIGESPATPSR